VLGDVLRALHDRAAPSGAIGVAAQRRQVVCVGNVARTDDNDWQVRTICAAIASIIAPKAWQRTSEQLAADATAIAPAGGRGPPRGAPELTDCDMLPLRRCSRSC
jgi:hypothetical protein